jgi:hypothetical protein
MRTCRARRCVDASPVRSGSTSASTRLSRNAGSYSSSPSPRSHATMSTSVPQVEPFLAFLNSTYQSAAHSRNTSIAGSEGCRAVAEVGFLPAPADPRLGSRGMPRSARAPIAPTKPRRGRTGPSTLSLAHPSPPLSGFRWGPLTRFSALPTAPYRASRSRLPGRARRSERILPPS